MAQRVITELVDDIDGNEAVETLHFGLDGTEFEIDLSQKNIDKLRKAMQPFVDSGRRVGRTRKTSGEKRTVSGPNPADVRQWAKEHGYEVTERGRIPAEIKDRYEAAH